MAGPNSSKRLVLYVPFAEIQQAKDAGAVWDKKKRYWHVSAAGDIKAVGRWLEKPRELSENDIIGQFADALRDAGLVLDGAPVMDGKWHRTPVESAKNAKMKQGVYKGNLDADRPNGFIENKLNGFSTPWSARGVILTPEQRAEFDQQARARSESQQREQEAAQTRAAAYAQKKWGSSREEGRHPYLDRKQVGAFGVRVDGGELVIPLVDAENRLCNVQRIFSDQERGKLFLKDARKTGCFHILGDIETSPTVLFAEGYATGASLHMATSLPVVLTFDSGNIDAVMRAVSARVEGKEKIVCGDEDDLPPSRILRRINGMLTTERTFAKLKLNSIDPDELKLDGIPRPARHNPECTLSLRVESGPHETPRIVGEIRNASTDGVLRVMLNNVGREKALAAAAEHGATAIFPRFASHDGFPTDFNDLHVREGLQAVSVQLKKVIQRGHETARVGHAEVEPARMQVFEPQLGARYIGQVIEISETHLTQQIGRGIAVRHNRATVLGEAAVGLTVEIAYANGRARLTDRAKRAVDKVLER
ncbi:KfrB domain-containing protein [Cupriavidus sp. D39]|uniref:KfrB domain-containing protein n=1 Tax=Cupriavidus sp. D39 TaxID=2997877 RepID=UPI002272212D|nr:DUF5710 domain-containing protein [Cupriavidus sp. D39]MCY0853055.1 DUF5710 domain-containing protein [Cupriavidus sp. D39]